MDEPGATSPTLQTVTSGTRQLLLAPVPRCDRVGVAAAAGVKLPGDGGPEPLRPGAEGQPVDGVLEEAEHDEPLGHVGRDAPCRQVVELVEVDRPDGGGVGAADVVAL